MKLIIHVSIEVTEQGVKLRKCSYTPEGARPAEVLKHFAGVEVDIASESQDLPIGLQYEHSGQYLAGERVPGTEAPRLVNDVVANMAQALGVDVTDAAGATQKRVKEVLAWMKQQQAKGDIRSPQALFRTMCAKASPRG